MSGRSVHLNVWGDGADPASPKPDCIAWPYWPRESCGGVPETDCPPRPSESSTMSSTAQARPRLWRNYRDNLHAGAMLTVLQDCRVSTTRPRLGECVRVRL